MKALSSQPDANSHIQHVYSMGDTAEVTTGQTMSRALGSDSGAPAPPDAEPNRPRGSKGARIIESALGIATALLALLGLAAGLFSASLVSVSYSTVTVPV